MRGHSCRYACRVMLGRLVMISMLLTASCEDSQHRGARTHDCIIRTSFGTNKGIFYGRRYSTMRVAAEGSQDGPSSCRDLSGWFGVAFSSHERRVFD